MESAFKKQSTRSFIQKQAAWGSLAVFIGLGIFFGVLAFLQGNVSRALLGFGAAAFVLVPLTIKWLGIDHPYKLYTVLFVFCILAYDIGCVYQRFDNWLHYDKFVHFLSGIVFTMMGVCLYYLVVKPRPDTINHNALAAITYGLGVSAFVAVGWEICEFSGFLLTGHDSQHHLTTGVFDTMGDLIACVTGSLISTASFLLAAAGKAKGLTPQVAEEFLQGLQGQQHTANE